MISQELEASLSAAFDDARRQRHEYVTVEHLLLALLDNPSAAEVLRACAANIEDLRESLTTFTRENTPTAGGSAEVDTQPTTGFQRVIQRAVMQVHSASGGKKDVTGALLLVALFGEKDSHALYYLHQQGVTRLDVVNYIAHGITKNKRDGAADPSLPPTADADPGQHHAVFENFPRSPEEVEASAMKGTGGPGQSILGGKVFALDLRRGAHALISDVRCLNHHRALLRAARGCCIVLSITETDDGLTLYTGEQVDAIRSEALVVQAAQAVCAAWREDHGADAVKLAIEALAAVLPSRP
jgi:hypothetical protein